MIQKYFIRVFLRLCGEHVTFYFKEMNMAAFYDREKEEKELRAILNSEPSLVYFVYGPINSGKTSLLIRVLDKLPTDMVPFYINLRGRDVSSAGEFLNVLFDVDEDMDTDFPEKTERAFIKDIVSMGLKMLERFSGIPVPMDTFNRLFREKDKLKDAYKYLENFFGEMVSNGLKPIFVIDELQVIKDVANAAGRPLLEKLFNFMVRITKETHLCHCLGATSDSLFVEEIQGNARLKGRSQYFLVDDLDRKESFQVYERFKFNDKDLVWSTIGGKIGDMMVLQAWLHRGYTEKDALERMLREETNRLRWVLGELKADEPDKYEERMKFLTNFVQYESLNFDPEKMLDEVIFWIKENILFLETANGVVCPQGQLIKRSIAKFQELKNENY